MVTDSISSVFQTDSKVVLDVFDTSNNYLVEYDHSVPNKICTLYFSSNNIYYPNKKTVFEKRIIEKNKYEWYGTRIKNSAKHIFLRDIKKQWYLGGINSKIDTPQSLVAFLKKETKDYDVIALGSSAGGFASVIYGQLLNAKAIYSFNGQFELNSLLQRSNELVDPLIFRYQHHPEIRTFYDTKHFIKHPEIIYYFNSAKSVWDKEQYNHIKELNVHTFRFLTSHHGIPFLKSVLPSLLNMSVSELLKHQGNSLNPIFFSIKIGGTKQTFTWLRKIFYDKISKIGPVNRMFINNVKR